MAHELEAAQVDAVGGLLGFDRKASHTAPPGTPCANCGVILVGPWCHDCGQLGEDFHRSWLHLVQESLEGLVHLDGRLWRTLPDLVLRPARLTRRYLEGHRAPQIPPLRLFLVVLLLLFFCGSISANFRPLNADKGVLTPEQQAKVEHAVAEAQAEGVRFSAADRQDLERKLRVARPGFIYMTPSEKESVKTQLAQMRLPPDDNAAPIIDWLREHLDRLIDRPEEFKLQLEAWGERFAFLMLPISALILSTLFVFQRRFYLFDHLIFSMHSLSFLGLLISTMMLLSLLGDWGILIFVAPVHLFAHMRGVYRTSILGTLIRMALLFVASLIGFCILIVALLLVGIASLQ